MRRELLDALNALRLRYTHLIHLVVVTAFYSRSNQRGYLPPSAFDSLTFGLLQIL